MQLFKAIDKLQEVKKGILLSMVTVTSRWSTIKRIRANFWSGLLFGLGAVLFIDETIFHQILHWHHFYDKSTTEIGLISDGFLHAFSWFATIGGLFWLANLKRHNIFLKMIWLAGLLVGAGAFQLYDGTIQHKLMRIHQIRYVDNVIIYDLVWNIIAVLLLISGFIFFVIAKKKITVV